MTRTALVTGCSTGIGRATARAFLDDGWRVHATARDPADVADLRERGATTGRLDVTSTGDAERAVDRVRDEHGRIDCLVNNAGYGQLGPVEDVPPDAVREQLDVNVLGPHRLMRAALPHMRRRGNGTIVNVTSFNARLPFAGTGIYAGSKSALSTISEAARQEVADSGVDVVRVAPAFVATDFYDRMRSELAGIDRSEAYAGLYDVLRSMNAIEGGGPGIVEPRRVAETILDAANHPDPRTCYTVGALAKLVPLVTALPASWRDGAMQLGVGLLTSAPMRRLLEWWNDRYRNRAEKAAPPQ